MTYKYIEHTVNRDYAGMDCEGLCCNIDYRGIKGPESSTHKALVEHNIPIHVSDNEVWANYYLSRWMNSLLCAMAYCGHAHRIGEEKAIALFAKIYQDEALKEYWSSLLTLDPYYLTDRRRHRKPFTSLKLAGYEVPSCKVR